MRGTLVGELRLNHHQGNTPAHAGNTCPPPPISKARRKHPRSCGEHPMTRCLGKASPETPPLMRGTPNRWSANSLSLGNTPAHAGNTRVGAGWPAAWRKHPRSCGEHSSINASMALVRETPPRLCGEHLAANSFPEFMAETPPLMRGTPVGQLPSNRCRRNTPAHAGNTRPTARRRRRPRKHSRSCGEHTCDMPHRLGTWETPPLMRGSHHPRFLRWATNGNTPAHAGITRNYLQLFHAGFDFSGNNPLWT